MNPAVVQVWELMPDNPGRLLAYGSGAPSHSRGPHDRADALSDTVAGRDGRNDDRACHYA